MFNKAYTDPKYDEACKYIHDYVRPVIRQAVDYRQAKHYLNDEAALAKSDEAAKDNDEEERYIFLYEVAKHTGNEIEIRDQVINTFIAGRDTIASLMSSTFFVLSRRPDIWVKLQAEVTPLSGKPPTFEQIKELKYLRNILYEALRLYPVVPINAKFANKDTFLPRGGGADRQSPIFVQKGQMVI